MTPVSYRASEQDFSEKHGTEKRLTRERTYRREIDLSRQSPCRQLARPQARLRCGSCPPLSSSSPSPASPPWQHDHSQPVSTGHAAPPPGVEDIWPRGDDYGHYHHDQDEVAGENGVPDPFPGRQHESSKKT